MKEYFKRLKKHPGIFYGIFLPILGFMSGTRNENFNNSFYGGLFGFIVIGIFIWLIILISNFNKK